MGETTRNQRKYTIAPPRAYEAYDIAAAKADEAAPPISEGHLSALLEQRREIAPEAARREEAREPAALPPEKRAVWVVHGMGQQIPFETLDSLAEGIMSVAHPPPGKNFEPRVRAVQIGGAVVERVELDVFENGRALELHLYEAYWAPITEGQVNLKDVVSFLFDGCFRGILNSNRYFRRAMFGEMANFKIRAFVPFEVWAALLTVVSLIILNTVIAAAGAAAYGLTGNKLLGMKADWISLSAVASGLSVMALTFGAMLFLAELSKPSAVETGRRPLGAVASIFIMYAGRIAFALTVLAVIVGGLYLGLHAAIVSNCLALPQEAARGIQGLETIVALMVIALVVCAVALRGIKRSQGNSLRGTGPLTSLFGISFLLFLAAVFGPVALSLTHISNDLPDSPVRLWQRPFWVWPFLIIVSYQVRKLLIQYVGDVAAYITPNKLDRFQEIRQKIKDVAMKSASAVYLAQENGQLLYKKVAVVGHSLGSVIAYDTLNALLNADALKMNSYGVAERTCLLETFGSPLDKIAFFFTIQGSDPYCIREQLAAAVQPLISDYQKFRTFPWVNVYSKNDIVSGPVNMYDLPIVGQSGAVRQTIAAHAVQHIIDEEAVVPLAAHVDYWHNREVWERLCNELTR